MFLYLILFVKKKEGKKWHKLMKCSALQQQVPAKPRRSSLLSYPEFWVGMHANSPAPSSHPGTTSRRPRWWKEKERYTKEQTSSWWCFALDIFLLHSCPLSFPGPPFATQQSVSPPHCFWDHLSFISPPILWPFTLLLPSEFVTFE